MTIEIFCDIETIPTPRADIQARCVADISPPGNYKKPEAIAEWWAREGEAKKADAVAMTALDGTWGETLCIGFAVNDQPAQVLMRSQASEVDLLNTFGLLLDSICKKELVATDYWENKATWIGHNLLDFDLRFLWQRTKVCSVKLPFKLPVGKPSYNQGPFVFDTMKEWAGYKERIKQMDLELAFGIERSDTITGADVFGMYQAGKFDVIQNHCMQDVENLRKIYRRMQ